MRSKIKHMAIVSQHYALEEKFYQAVFGMKISDSRRVENAAVVSDGYVGLNINPRRPGRQAGLDHFGFEVEDVENVYERLNKKYPNIRVSKRPGGRPFAGLSTHDPAGNVFDLSQSGMENRTDVYTDTSWEQDRSIRHLALRAIEPEKIAEFYREMLDLLETEKPADDPNYYLTDGRVTLVIMPWQIMDYQGGGIERPALDHIGFKVESVDAVKDKLIALANKNPSLSPGPLEAGPEGKVRCNLLSRCAYGHYGFSDPDGVLIDIAE